MAIEEISRNPLEIIEDRLKGKLSQYGEEMPVKWWRGATLLEIYWEWMDYLIKEDLKNKSDLFQAWKYFLLNRDTDIIARLLISFFQAKRRYGRDLQRGEIKRDWFALCDNYCKHYGHRDDALIKRFFSSYSGAERRIYHKIEKWEVLASTSESLLKTFELTKAEMIKKEEDKKRKEEERAEEKRKKEEEKQMRKEERAKKAEEKKRLEEEKRRKREEEKARKAEEKKLKSASKSKKVKAVENVTDEQEDDREPDVDPDYPKPQEGWRDPVQPWTESSDTGNLEHGQNVKKNNGKKGRKWWNKDDGQLSFDFWEE